MVGIASVKPMDCTFHYAFDIFRRVNRSSDHPRCGLLEMMNWRGVTRGYPEGDQVIRIIDCVYRDKSRDHVHSTPKWGHVTIKECEYLMAIHLALLPYHHYLSTRLLKYLPNWFNRQFGMDQNVLVAKITTMIPVDHELCSHTDKKGGNLLVQVAKAWKQLWSQNTNIYAIRK